MQTVLIVIHILVVLALIGVVLLQKSEGGALGMGGGGGGFMTSRGSGNVLTKATAILAATFFATSLLLSVIAGLGRQGSIFQGGAAAPAGQTGPAPASGDSGKSILDQLKQQSAPESTPPAPAPTGPQVPQSK